MSEFSDGRNYYGMPIPAGVRPPREVYEDSISNMAKGRAKDAQDAAEFRAIKQRQREQGVADKAASGAVQAVERRLAQKAAEARLLDIQDIATAGGFGPEWVAMANSLTSKPDSYPLAADDLGLLAPHRSQEALASEAASLRGKSGGNLSLDDLAFLSRQVSDDAYAAPSVEDRRIDSAPSPRGLAETYRGQ